MGAFFDELANPIARIQSTNPVADQTQQMANNPIYGQESPFQPQQNPNVGKSFGMPPDSGMGFGKSFGGFQTPKYDPNMGGTQQLYDQYNQIRNRMSADINPVDQMNFQQFVDYKNGKYTPNFGIGLPMEPYQPNPLEGSPIADIGGGGLPNPIAGMPNIGAGGQLIGGPAGKPILGPGQQMPQPMMPPGGSVGQQMPQPMMPPGGSVGQQPISGARNIGQIAGGPVNKPITNQPQPFRGGLRPAPRNYRPPQRGGNLRSFIGR
jgi:hypothetical protein